MSEIMEWLKGHDAYLFCMGDQDYIHLIRVPYTDTIEYIYSQNNFSVSKLERGNFEYAGIFNRGDGLVYDANYDLHRLLASQEYDRGRDHDSIYKAFEDQVNARIKAIIAGDRTNLHVTEADITDKYLKRKLDDAKTCHQRDRVRSLVLGGVKADSIHFSPWFCVNETHFDSDLIINILEECETLVEKTAEKWIDKNRAEILIRFISDDLLKADLAAVYADPEHPLFLIKKIMDAVAGDYKTVNVTTVIDGKELTFKTDACVLQHDPNDAYYTYRMAAPDRRKFENLYGRNRDYYPQEIIKITYGKRVLYQK